ncbi:hypothetical protein C454_16591 [Haloferax gibbonsii ATCC 33959]|uniref:Uncharacterized protein n=2 Tax=Haloferax gibbonsii TaxID=35746 RepID=M0GYG7_HALGM|nr:hypothetical protein C454_16591 [Haloferax gibbonsii ATCC 33959]
MDSMDDLNLTDNSDDEPIHIFRITSKGRQVASGIKRGLGKLDPGFSEKLDTISSVAHRNKNRSGSEIVEDDDIQEAKEETYQSNV